MPRIQRQLKTVVARDRADVLVVDEDLKSAPAELDAETFPLQAELCAHPAPSAPESTTVSPDWEADLLAGEP